jgi:RimJ/RimL family protein N-acetyltransferase
MQEFAPATSVLLRDRTPVLIRPISPRDKDLLRNSRKRLSGFYRHQSLLAVQVDLTEGSLQSFTNADYKERSEWVAVDPADDEERLLGVARYVRTEADPHVAEIAIGVVDSHQGRGLGTLLIHALADAAVEHGVRYFVANFPAGDAPGLRLLRSLGNASIRIENMLAHVEVALPGAEQTSNHKAGSLEAGR